MIGRRNHALVIALSHIASRKETTGTWTPPVSSMLIHRPYRTMRRNRNPRKRGRNRNNRLRFSQRTLPALHSMQTSNPTLDQIGHCGEFRILPKKDNSQFRTSQTAPYLSWKGLSVNFSSLFLLFACVPAKLPRTFFTFCSVGDWSKSEKDCCRGKPGAVSAKRFPVSCDYSSDFMFHVL